MVRFTEAPMPEPDDPIFSEGITITPAPNFRAAESHTDVQDVNNADDAEEDEQRW